MCVSVCVVYAKCHGDLSHRGLSEAASSLSPCSAHYIEWTLKMVTEEKKKREKKCIPAQPCMHNSLIPVTLYFTFPYCGSFAKCSFWPTFLITACHPKNTRSLLSPGNFRFYFSSLSNTNQVSGTTKNIKKKQEFFKWKTEVATQK